MSEIEPLYCAEQIKVPPAMPEILKAWTKAVIRENVSQVSNIFCITERDKTPKNNGKVCLGLIKYNLVWM